MVDILSEGTNPKQRQVFHSRTARSFDEGQLALRSRPLASHTEKGQEQEEDYQRQHGQGSRRLNERVGRK